MRKIKKIIKATTNMKAYPKLFDIAANVADERFKDDIKIVFERAKVYGVQKLLMGGTYLEDSLKSYEFSKLSPDYYCTAGIHPCRAAQHILEKKKFEEYFAEIEKIIQSAEKGKIVAVGECGLDYDRFSYADKEAQLKAFPPHFDLAFKYHLPMYLHERSTNGDFSKLIKENRAKFSTGVVHSFTGTIELMKEFISMDLYIGINGCSLKTDENLKMVKEVPLDRLCLETDSPYCQIRKSTPAYKFIKTHFKPSKGKKLPTEMDTICRDRNEPCTTIQVLEVVSALKGIPEEIIAKAAWENSLKVFGI